jgi:hypothetical protein
MIKHFLYILACCIILAGCTRAHLDIFPPLSSENMATKKLTIAQMHDDILALYTGVLERHPDLTSYADLNTLQMAIDDLNKQVIEPMNRQEFYRIVGQLSYLFNDGHTFLIWPYQEYSQLKEQGSKPFPFVIEKNEEGVFIKQSYFSDDQILLAGIQLVSINGHKIEDVFAHAQHFVGGETLYLREQLVADRFSQMLWSVYGYINNFELVIQIKGEQQSLIINPNQTWKLKQSSKIKPNQAFYYKEIRKGVGYLYVSHFDVDNNWFEEFLDKTFEKIHSQNIETLIIDIRDNSGGNTDAPSYLASYIAHKPFRMVSQVKERLNSENRGLFNYKGNVGDILVEQWDDYIEPKNSNNLFEGNVFLLISPISYSSAIVFATALKDNNMAVLVGQPTGGFANQTAQGNLFNLPNSELRAYVTTRLLLRPSGDESVVGVQPDVVTKPSQQDLLADKDTEIEAVLQQIDGRKKK